MEVSAAPLVECLCFSLLFHSGNGLVSYYINLVLDGVGVKNAGTKAEINGGLQVMVSFMSGGIIYLRFSTDLEPRMRLWSCFARRQTWSKDAIYRIKCGNARWSVTL